MTSCFSYPVALGVITSCFLLFFKKVKIKSNVAMYYSVMCLVCLPECCLVVAFRNVLLPWTLEDTPQTAGGSVLLHTDPYGVFTPQISCTERSTCATSRMTMRARDRGFEMSRRTSVRARQFRFCSESGIARAVMLRT